MLTVMEAAQQPRDTIRVGALEIHPTEGLAVAEGVVLSLSVREFGLLVALVQRSGRIVSRSELYTLVWDSELRDGDRSIDVYVHKLRMKLEQALPDERFIHTHVGFGYRFSPSGSATPKHDHEESL
jgi:DNA-binding response OmpR family regulator